VSDIDTEIDNERETVQTGSTWWTYYPNLICCTCNPQLNGEPSGLKQNKAPHISKDWTPLSVFMFSGFVSVQHLVEETNRYYHQCLDMTGGGRTPLPDMNVQEIYLFLSIVWVRHNQRDTLKTVSYSLLWNNSDKRCYIYWDFYTSMTWTWYNWWKLQPIVENESYIT
jgi:hypothetical protein